MNIEENSQAGSDFSDFTLMVQSIEGFQFLPETPLLRPVAITCVPSIEEEFSLDGRKLSEDCSTECSSMSPQRLFASNNIPTKLSALNKGLKRKVSHFRL